MKLLFQSSTIYLNSLSHRFKPRLYLVTAIIKYSQHVQPLSIAQLHYNR